MNCYYHADAPAVAFCRTCGHPLCAACQRPDNGTIFCPEHARVASQAPPPGEAFGANPYFQPGAPPLVQTSPALAFALGFIPGVGAIYNGQYLKGLIHAVIFGFIISLLASNENAPVAPLFGILLAAFIFYMPFEAFHTAKKRQAGIPVDEWSSLAPPSRPGGPARNTPVGPVILICIGVLFLLDTLDLIEFRHIGRFWPVLLIAGGAYMLYTRTTGRGGSIPSNAVPSAPPPGYSNGPYATASYPPAPYAAPPSREADSGQDTSGEARHE